MDQFKQVRPKYHNKMKTAFDHIDSRGKMHSSDWDRQQAESKYARERDQQGKDLTAAAKYGAIQSARAAEAPQAGKP